MHFGSEDILFTFFQKAGRVKKRSATAKKRAGSGGFGSPPAKKKVPEDDGKIVITADNPISCLFEYAKKVGANWSDAFNVTIIVKFQVKIADPEFDCVAENLLETWQKGNQTFKKVGW